MANSPPNVTGINILTPTGGVFQWNAKNKKMIREHYAYHYEFLLAINKLENDGPNEVVFPKKPKGRLESLMEVETEKTILSGEDLHVYMQKHLVLNPTPYCPELDRIFPDLQTMEPFLQSGYEGLTANSSSSLVCHMEFGRYLCQAFQLFQQQKYGPHIKESWADYLDANIGISDTYAKQLRYVAEKFFGYKKFHSLGLSFAEVYRLRKQIENMLALYPEINQFWLG